MAAEKLTCYSVKFINFQVATPKKTYNLMAANQKECENWTCGTQVHTYGSSYDLCTYMYMYV